MIFAVIGAIAVGLSLGVFGAGGSILTVPILVYLLGHADRAAIAESLAIVGGIALFGAIPYARAKLLDWRTGLLFGLPGMAGAYAGAALAAYVAGAVQLLVFAAVMLFASIRMWKNSAPASAKRPPGDRAEHQPRAAARVIIDGLAVGVLTGFVGVGGGFLIVPALVLLAGLPMRRAIATSLFIIAIKSAAGFWKYTDILESGAIDWTTIAVFIAFGAAGTFAGKAIATRIDQRALKRGFAVFLAIMAAVMLAKETASLLAKSDASQSAPADQA